MVKTACLEVLVSFPEELELTDAEVSAAAAECARIVERELKRYREQRKESTKRL
ncbi:MAG: hypothetical protein NWF05_05465 [Candidatus Bathyarchaeota archaeon]|nr:hypothetical protein [Candidatus Bathyarchaeota archaeon]